MFRVIARCTTVAAEMHLRAVARADGVPVCRRRGEQAVLTWAVCEFNAASGLAERLREVGGVRVVVECG